MLFMRRYLLHKMIRPTDRKLLTPGTPHIRVCANIDRPRCLIMFSRGMGKSTLKNMLYTWRICTNPDGYGGRQILDFTNSQTVSRSVREVSSELLFNKAIIADFGRLMNSKSKLSIEKSPELITKNGWGIIAKSIESGIRGLHPAEIDIDDVLDREQIKNPELRKKLFDIYAYDVQGMLFPGFSERFWGTPMHPEDLICTLYEQPDWNVRLRYPAERTDKDGNRFSMWPDMWTLEDLDKIRIRLDKVAPGSYQQEYLLKPFLSANLLWIPDMIQYWNRRPPHHDMLVHTGIDLAYGVREENCETCISSWGILLKTTDWGDQGMIFELRTDLGHFSPDQVVNITLQHCNEFNFKNKIRAEDKVWTNALWPMLREGCNRMDIPPSSLMFQPIKVGPGEDKKTRAMGVIQFWKDHLVFQDIDSPAAGQMLNFTGRPKERNDAVDAPVHAISGFVGRQLYGGVDFGRDSVICREPVYDVNSILR